MNAQRSTRENVFSRTSRPSSRNTKVTVDLAAYPDLVVVYLGFHVSTWRGLKALMGIGRQLTKITRDRPDGLLAHESVFYALNHIGMRQYWRDLESLESFTRSDPHKTWWRDFSKSNAGTGFWHEAYRRKGGMEGLYIGMPKPIGFGAFAAECEPAGAAASSRGRLAA